MTDECQWCDHAKRMLDQERIHRASTFELYATYYKQTHAQAKGIRRLRKQIARLKTMLASAQDKKHD